MFDRELDSLVIAAKAAAGRASGDAPGDPSGDAPGDPVTTLLTRAYPSLLGYALKLTCDRYLAEEVCQETMVRVIAGFPRYRPVPGRVGAGFQAWLFRIATNVHRDMCRKAARMVLVPDPYAVVTPGAATPRASASIRPGVGAPAEEEAIQNIERRTVMDALAALPVEQRIVLTLRTYHDCSYKEISQIARCPEGTAKSRLHYAVLALREELRRKGVL
ncbi:MAG TPA: sigma-70 family RNA polymerase sigma factor [Firmicutes bacterium]|nr:sigma-70 family RNA polymerase sigma factor [Bacillota bacterium]